MLSNQNTSASHPLRPLAPIGSDADGLVSLVMKPILETGYPAIKSVGNRDVRAHLMARSIKDLSQIGEQFPGRAEPSTGIQFYACFALELVPQMAARSIGRLFREAVFATPLGENLQYFEKGDGSTVPSSENTKLVEYLGNIVMEERNLAQLSEFTDASPFVSYRTELESEFRRRVAAYETEVDKMHAASNILWGSLNRDAGGILKNQFSLTNAPILLDHDEKRLLSTAISELVQLVCERALTGGHGQTLSIAESADLIGNYSIFSKDASCIVQRRGELMPAHIWIFRTILQAAIPRAAAELVSLNFGANR